MTSDSIHNVMFFSTDFGIANHANFSIFLIVDNNKRVYNFPKHFAMYFERLKFEERRCAKISFTLMCNHKIWPFFQRPCSPWSPLALTKTPKKPDAMVQYESWIIFGSESIFVHILLVGLVTRERFCYCLQLNVFSVWTRTLAISNFNL